MPSSRRAIIGWWFLVVAGFAVGLAALDRVPALLVGAPHRVRVYATIEEAQRALGAPIWLPAYYPDRLAWPPARIDVWPGHPATVAVHIEGRGESRERLLVVQSIGGRATAPPLLLPPVQVLLTTAVELGGRTAVVTRVVARDGEVMHDVSWEHGERRLTLRFRGPVEQLLRIAGSLERTQQ